MNPLTLGFIGDLHLDKLTKHWSNANELQINEVRKVLGYFASRGITRVVFLGDLGETSVMSDDAKVRLFMLLTEFHQSKKMTFHLIIGNHDYSHKHKHGLHLVSEIGSKFIPEGLFIYSEPTLLEWGGVPINLSPFPYGAEVEGALNIGHLETAKAKTDSGRIITSSKHNFKGQWVMGHLHTKQKVGSVFYPGTLYQTNFGERLPKGFLITQAAMKDGILKCKHEWIESQPTFSFETVDIEKREDLGKLSISPYTRYRVRIVSGLDINPALLMESRPNIAQVLLEDTLLTNEQGEEIVSEALKFQEAELLKTYLKQLGYKKALIKKIMAVRFGDAI